MNENRDGFGSKLGAIAAAAGSAIGLGNIYRFPCLAGENGGGAFLLIYIAIVLCLGIPIMMAEFYIGRRGGKNPVGSIKELSPKTHWNLIGYIGILAAFVVLAFYSTVSGWTLEYIYKAATNFFADKDIATIEQGFTDFNNNPFRPFLWQFLFMGLTAFIIFKGVKEGVEKYTKILMPALFVILIILCVKSLTLDGAGEGLKFLFKPDFSKVDANVLLAALGQAFFSLSVGMGALITYGSYISKKDNLATTSLSVVAADTIVAHLRDFKRTPQDYDKIITGDLGVVGKEILLNLLQEQGFDATDVHEDCGMLIYDNEWQDTHSGGSGCGCSAATFASYLLNELREGTWSRILFVPTGALLSPVSSNEGRTIPGIAHAVVVESR